MLGISVPPITGVIEGVGPAELRGQLPASKAVHFTSFTLGTTPDKEEPMSGQKYEKLSEYFTVLLSPKTLEYEMVLAVSHTVASPLLTTLLVRQESETEPVAQER